jgi:hypothetical protein
MIAASSSRFRTAVTYMFVGALSFWMPDVVLSALLPNGHVLLITDTLVLPTVALSSYFIVLRHRPAKVPSLSLWMVVGILFFGSPFMLWTATLKGGGTHSLVPRDYLFEPLFMLFPPYTFMLSGYDLTLFALLITIIGFIVCFFKFERPRAVA